MLSALYYDKGYLSVQIGTPRVMLTPDRQGIDISISIHEGPRYKIRQLRIYERDNEGQGGRAPRRPARAAPDDPRAVGRLLQPRGAHQGARRGAHALPRRRLRQRRGRARDAARSGARGGRHRRADPPRAARAHRAHRGEGQHQDARQGHPPRDGHRGGGALQRDRASRLQQAPHHRARLLRARRRLDRAGLGARQASSSTSR